MRTCIDLLQYRSVAVSIGCSIDRLQYRCDADSLWRLGRSALWPYHCGDVNWGDVNWGESFFAILDSVECSLGNLVFRFIGREF